MTMLDIHNCIPPRPSGQHIGVLLGVGIKPMEELVRVAVADPFMILVSGALNPFVKVVGWLMFVSAVGIAMAMIASMFGAVMADLKPLVSFAIILHDLL